jgi:hypothetical protein
MSAIPDWLPGCPRVAGEDAGSMLPGSKWSLLLHTTEGSSVQGAISALRAKSAWSHFIYDPNTDYLVQCVSMNRAAKSLRSGGNFGKTNAARVIQVEIVGSAKDADTWPSNWNENIGKMIARIARSVPFRVEMPLPFYGDKSGFTVASATAKQRLSWPAWYRFDAICGHQHAPRNDHWDPGAINTAQILHYATKEVGLIVTPDDEAKIRAIFADELSKVVNPDKKGNMLIRLRNSAALTEKNVKTLLRRK